MTRWTLADFTNDRIWLVRRVCACVCVFDISGWFWLEWAHLFGQGVFMRPIPEPQTALLPYAGPGCGISIGDGLSALIQ